MAEKYLDYKEMKILDINSQYFGTSTIQLMENSGREVCGAIRKKLGVKGKKILLLCGTGNNGGDGFVAARYLYKKGAKVKVALIGKEKSIRTREAKENWKSIKELDTIDIDEIKDLNFGDFDIIVDSILGMGSRGELREPIKSIVKRVNASKAFKVSVDLPTGLNIDGKGMHIDADLVVTFHSLKKGLGNINTVVADIGIPKKAESYVGPGDVIVDFPKRREDSHKGDNGKVLVVGGSDLYYGAPILSGLSALNSGCDLVYLLVPEVNFEVTRTFLPDFIVRKYGNDHLSSEGVSTVLDLSGECDSLVIGPGLGTREGTKEAILEILDKIKIPVVIDADAIKALQNNHEIFKKINSVITPHSGEFKALTGDTLPKNLDKRKEVVTKFSRKLDSTILLKSFIDIIASPSGKLKFNSTGNPGMTVGGTGDVLAGLLGGLMAQGMELFEASCCSAFVCGVAGNELLDWKGYSFRATDLAEEIPFTIKGILNMSES